MVDETYTIDRFEGDFAVCETSMKMFIHIDKNFVPPQAREGDIIILQADGRYKIDYDKTFSTRERIRKKMNRLWD